MRARLYYHLKNWQSRTDRSRSILYFAYLQVSTEKTVCTLEFTALKCERENPLDAGFLVRQRLFFIAL
jgi:hypothetical protein